jgi:hypothetical protein
MVTSAPEEMEIGKVSQGLKTSVTQWSRSFLF